MCYCLKGYNHVLIMLQIQKGQESGFDHLPNSNMLIYQHPYIFFLIFRGGGVNHDYNNAFKMR